MSTLKLPPGWVEEINERLGEVYYVHEESGETSWDPPDGAEWVDEPEQKSGFLHHSQSAPAGPVVDDDAGKEVWLELETDSGEMYYYNADSQETVWDKPSGRNVVVRPYVDPDAAANKAKSKARDKYADTEEVDDDDETTSTSVRPVGLRLADEEEEEEEDTTNPDDWMELYDPNSGLNYYHNKTLGTTVWEMPKCLQLKREAEAKAAEEASGSIDDDEEEKMKMAAMRRRGRSGRTASSVSIASTSADSSNKRVFEIPRPNKLYNLLNVGVNTSPSSPPASDGVLFLDVRHPDMYAQGHLPLSINIPVQEIDSDDFTVFHLKQNALSDSDFGALMDALEKMREGKRQVIIIGHGDRCHLRTVQPTPVPVRIAQAIASHMGDDHKRELIGVLEAGFSMFERTYPFLLCKGCTAGSASVDDYKTVHSPLQKFPVEIMDGTLFIGDKNDAADLTKMKQLGITHVINCTTDVPNYHEDNEEAGLDYSRIPIANNMEHQLSAQAHQIHVALYIMLHGDAETRVLLHCEDGLQVSPVVIMSYYMQEKRETLVKAFEFVRERLPTAHPNPEFLLQLQELEFQALGTSTLEELFTKKDVLSGIRSALARRQSLHMDPEQAMAVAREKSHAHGRRKSETPSAAGDSQMSAHEAEVEAKVAAAEAERLAAAARQTSVEEEDVEVEALEPDSPVDDDDNDTGNDDNDSKAHVGGGAEAATNSTEAKQSSETAPSAPVTTSVDSTQDALLAARREREELLALLEKTNKVDSEITLLEQRLLSLEKTEKQ